MEALLFLLDTIALIAMAIMVLKNERRAPGEPQVGPFRYVETRLKPKTAPAPWKRQQ